MDLPSVFHDVTPLLQDDGPQPVCAIDYPSEYVEAMDYLRAVLRSDEHSERTLKLTEVCLKFNPANYTTWHFRRQCLASLSDEIQTKKNDNDNHTTFDIDRVKYDLELSARLGGSNPKNYQIWYHRRNLLDGSFSQRNSVEDYGQKEIGLVSAELEYIKSVFDNDAKNYHAWSHRQWIIKLVDKDNIWIDEIDYVETLIKDDVRNNSAWNQRWFASHRAVDDPLSLANARVETEYALKCARLDVYNESPWTYLLAIIKEQHKRVNDCTDDEKTDVIELIRNCESKLLAIQSELKKEKNCDGHKFIHLISTYIDLLEIKKDKHSCKIAVDLVHGLATKYDPIRKKYWSMKKNTLLSQI